MDNISSDFQENKIYATHTAGGGRAKAHYDLTLISWDLMLERINSLKGNERVDFLESLFTFPPVGRYRLKKGNEDAINKYFPIDDDISFGPARNEFENLEPFEVQKMPGFEKTVFTLLVTEARNGFYPIFGSVVGRGNVYFRFNLNRIRQFGEEELKGDLKTQILYYTYLTSEFKRLSVGQEPYLEADDYLFILTNRHDKEMNAVSQVALAYSEGKLLFYKEQQNQLSNQIGHDPETEIKAKDSIPQPQQLFFGPAWIGDDESEIMTPIAELKIYEFREDGYIYLLLGQGDLGWMLSKLNEKGYIDMKLLRELLPSKLRLRNPKGDWITWDRNKLSRIISESTSSTKEHSKKLHIYLSRLQTRNT